ncbi:MAG: hypothetical protein KC417_18040, partial [Myxococcales bacterium]|nr:hypothetical protein [Myxococcales bacterium]
VGAGVYTLVLMFNAEVKQAFDLAESHGWSADQILAHFGYGAASGRASGGPPSGGGQSGGGQGAPPAGGSQPPPPRSFGGPPSGGPPPPRSL